MTATQTIVCTSCGAINRAPAERLAAGASPRCGRCHTALFAGKPHDVATADEFQELLAATTLPILIDFWAPWCGPCLAMAPHFEAAAVAIEPRARLLKVDTQALPDLAARYSVRSIPTLVIVRNGREIARSNGARDAGAIARWFAASLRN